MTMGVVFLLIALFIFIRQGGLGLYPAIISLSFFILAFTNPNLLKVIYIPWMKLAFILSWVNTRLILFIIYYLIFAPIGLGMRLFGVDLLNRKIDKGRDSYWIKKEKRAFSSLDYERQF